MTQIHLPHDHGEASRTLAACLPEQEDFANLAEQFRQLSDGSRLRLFWLLCHCRECVTNLSAMMGMSAPAVSHHLRQLKVSGLVTSHRQGKEVYYQAVDTAQARELHRTMETMMQITCPEHSHE